MRRKQYLLPMFNRAPEQQEEFKTASTIVSRPGTFASKVASTDHTCEALYQKALIQSSFGNGILNELHSPLLLKTGPILVVEDTVIQG